MGECSSSNPSMTVRLTVILFLLYRISSIEGNCQLCDELISSKAVSLPDPYSFITTCGQLAGLLALFDETSEECQAIQSLKTFCGCPIPESACQLCTEGSVQNMDQAVDFALLPDLVTPTCGLVEAFLHSFNSESSTCTDAEILRDTCICSETQVEPPTTTPVTTSPCSLCRDTNDAFAFPEKDVTDFIRVSLDGGGTGGDLLAGGNITCQMVSLFLQSEEESTQTCSDARYYLSGICGCPALEESGCQLCNEGDEIDLDSVVGITQLYNFPEMKCSDILLFTQSIDKSDDICVLAQRTSYLCGCNDGQFDYLFTGSSVAKKKALAWCPRVTAFFSFLGSIYIINDVLKRRPKISVYQELICSISVFDVISSIAWMLTTVTIPEYNDYGDPTAVYGAKGNDGLCTTQAFLLQLGAMGSVFYNAALSFFYLLTIRYSWREVKMRSFKKYFHVASFMAVVFAITGIPFYGNGLLLCYLEPRPFALNNKASSALLVVPVSLSIAVATINTILVYCKVRKQEQKANRWRFSTQTSKATDSSDGAVKRATSKLERAVFWQSLFYLGAFYLVWPMFMEGYISTGKKDRSYTYWLIMATVTPLQGFLNVVVYTRPRPAKKMNDLQQRITREEDDNTETSRFWRRLFRKTSRPKEVDGGQAESCTSAITSGADIRQSEASGKPSSGGGERNASSSD